MKDFYLFQNVYHKRKKMFIMVSVSEPEDLTGKGYVF